MIEAGEWAFCLLNIWENLNMIPKIIETKPGLVAQVLSVYHAVVMHWIKRRLSLYGSYRRQLGALPKSGYTIRAIREVMDPVVTEMLEDAGWRPDKIKEFLES